MGLSIYNIKKWTRMIFGKSIEHVNQGVGKVYSPSEIKGYYNDLTEKVTKDKDFNLVKLPVLKIQNGSTVMFPISIFQYGLGAYDLFILEKKRLFLDKFKLSVDWALQNQEESGAWNNFFFDSPNAPYSSMAQGEGISLLIRAYKEFDEEKYLSAAKKAVNFLVTPVELGGTTKYIGDEIFLQEFTNRPTVLNGWIFSLFGLYDYLKVVKDKEIKDIYNRSVQTMVNHIRDFDNEYWSKYDINTMIASPFYHRLHIAQLNVMHEITGEVIFREYFEKWVAYEKRPINRSRAFITKAIQKIIEK